eukprot:365164_1
MFSYQCLSILQKEEIINVVIQNMINNGDTQHVFVIQTMLKDQHYAIVLNALGNNRLEVFCMDVKLRIAYIRKTIARQKRTMWIKPNDLILISMRDFDSYKCDVIHK